MTTLRVASRSDLAYTHIRDGLLTGRWRAGEVLSTYSLAQELEISRTPIMEALKRLEAEGYLEIVPQVGCVVRGASAQQIRELFYIRAAIEGVAVELAAEKISEADLQALRDNLTLSALAVERGDATNFQNLNRAFHLLIVRSAGVPMLDAIVTGLWQRKEYETGSLPYFQQRLANSLIEHRQIVEHLAAHAPAAARAATEAHVRGAAELFAQLVEEPG